MLPEDLTHDADRKRRFIQEAQAASALERSHIAVIHDVDEADGFTFIAMELIRGHKLSDILTSTSPSPVPSNSSPKWRRAWHAHTRKASFTAI